MNLDVLVQGEHSGKPLVGRYVLGCLLFDDENRGLQNIRPGEWGCNGKLLIIDEGLPVDVDVDVIGYISAEPWQGKQRQPIVLDDGVLFEDYPMHFGQGDLRLDTCGFEDASAEPKCRITWTDKRDPKNHFEARCGETVKVPGVWVPAK
jgi:hypothetical protein